MSNKISIFLQDTTDEIIALIVIITAVFCVILGIITPDWFNMLTGMVGMYYFKKKTNGE